MVNSPYCQMANCSLDIMDFYDIDYYCLPQKHTFLEDFLPTDAMPFFSAEVAGIGATTLPGFQLIFRLGWGCGYTIGTESINLLSALPAYPNPVADVLYLDMDTDLQANIGHIQFDIAGVQGNTLVGIATNDGKRISLDIAALPRGFYIGRLHTEKIVRTFKFVKW